MKRSTIKVEGMHCHGCEMLIKMSLKEIEGILNVEVSHNNGEVVVEFDETKVSLQEIHEVINREGYSPREELNSK